MAITLNGSTQYILGSNTPVTAYPCTFFAYFNPTVTNVAQYLWAIDNSASTIVNGLRIRAAGDVGGPPMRGTTGDGTTTSAISTSTNFSASTWQKAMFICTNATSRDIRLNNGGIGSDANNLTPTGLNRGLIGVAELLAVLSGFFNGQIAHPAVWNIALVTLDQARIQAGLSPKLVAKNNLVAYLPLWDSAFGTTNLFGATTWAAQASPSYSADPGIKFNNNNMMMGMS